MTEPLISPDERIVRIREIVDGVERVFYAIQDVRVEYWRSEEPIGEYGAWTRDRRYRAEFDNRADARDELEMIRRWRGGLAPSDWDEMLPESEAA